MLDFFHALVAIHIVFGAVGLVTFWPPVIGRKGDRTHKRVGKVFAWAILGAGGVAVLLSLTTLYDPLGTHPKLDDADFVRGIFGVMMLYLAILTINLAWYALQTIRNRRDHDRNRRGFNLWLQPILFVAATACAIEGVLIGQYLMVGMSVIGFATVGTNLMFMLNATPGPKDWLKEHVKGIVGAGISVYTAFFAFGAVRIMPEAALHFGLWSVPLVTGLAIILYHWRKIGLSLPKRAAPGRA